MPPFNYNQLSIAIPTNGRPSSLKNCIQSVITNISKDCQIYVLDSTPLSTSPKVQMEYRKIYKTFPSINLLKFHKNVPPGKARKLLSEQIKTEFALFLDDDLEITKDAFAKMSSALLNENYDVMSGIWLEGENTRCIGFLYSNLIQDNTNKIIKCAVSPKTVPPESIVQLDDVQASLLIRMKIFETVQFDERYDFFYELYDFFYQCKNNAIKVGVHTGSIFHHHPLPYRSKSSRYYQNRETDRTRFIDKWNIYPEVARY